MGNDWYDGQCILVIHGLVIKNEPNGEYTERFINLGKIITGLGNICHYAPSFLRNTRE